MRNLKLLGLLVGGALIACGGGGSGGTGGTGGSGNSGGSGGSGNNGGSGGDPTGGTGGNASGGGGNASGGGGSMVGCTDPIDCDDGDVCTVDDCVASSCSNVAVNVDDNDLCTNDTCDPVLGEQHAAVNIDDNDACTTDACDALTGVSHVAVDIDDSNACTDDACSPVSGVSHTPVALNDNNACTTDACNQVTGVSHTPVNPADNNVCTIDTCFPASGVVNLGEISVFFEDFSDNSAGWTLGNEWDIGPAAASPPFNAYAFGWTNIPLTDPDTDHTGTADNGVAGVVIGGNANPVVHGYDYLESPAIDISVVPNGAKVELRFWRWLNSDYDPYMHNTVEVYNGAAWVTLPGWPTVGAPQIMDTPPVGNGWFLMSYDVTAYAGPNFRARWGFDITSGGVYTIGSWNLDDVEVAFVSYTPSSDQCKIESCSVQFGTVLSDYPNNDNNPVTLDVCDPQRGPHHEYNLYQPFGVQQNLPAATITNGGWSQCYLDNYSNSATAMATIQAQCSKSKIMMGCRPTAAANFTVAAWAPRVDVFFDTGTGNVLHNSNNVGWYYNSSWSWGFAPQGQAVNRNSCDIINPANNDRMCWHTGSNNINSGYRCGATVSFANNYERVVFHAD